MTPNLIPQNLNAPTSARIVSLLVRGARRRRLQQATREGRLIQVAAVDALALEGLPRLARRSVWLLFGSAALFAVCIGVARQLLHAPQLLGNGPLALRLALLIVANIVGYVAILPLHEAAHAAAILALGGRPRFGLKLPLAAYCTAPNQLFLRAGYLAVALAPLVVISALLLVVVALWPNVAACLLLAFAGNVSGAVGDLEVAGGVLRLPPQTLIADTETGYIAYTMQESR